MRGQAIRFARSIRFLVLWLMKGPVLVAIFGWKNAVRESLYAFLDFFSPPWLPGDEPDTSESVLPSESVGVSVVIPVLNGAEELPGLLGSLVDQTGVELQIIIIDSGSTDGTLDLMSRFPVEVHSITPEAFTHSAARNLGVSLARHDLVFLTVQDAHLPHTTWLRGLVDLLTRHGLAALSTQEVPRPGADLYARYSLWAHYRGLGLTSSVTRTFHKLPAGRRTRRAAASLSDVACLYRTDIVRAIPFSGTFGEDFTMGVRLLEEHLGVGTTGVYQVIHSHDRSAFYWLRRAFVSLEILYRHGLADLDMPLDARTVRTYIRDAVHFLGVAGELCGQGLQPGEITRSKLMSVAPGAAPYDLGLTILKSQDIQVATLTSLVVGSGQGPEFPRWLQAGDYLLDLFAYVADEESRDPMRPSEFLPLLAKSAAARIGWILGRSLPFARWTPEIKTVLDALGRGV